MSSLGEVVRRHGARYLLRFGSAVPLRHRKALRAIGACRTGELGSILYHCATCGSQHRIGRSCGNRHCPACQHHKTQAWLQRQLALLLPCPYFFITFTVPAELRPFIRSHPRITYNALFQASSQALKRLAANPRWVGTDSPGFLGVLHTWGRALPFHPHVHYIVPGGGPSPDGSRWLPSRANFFVPDPALSNLFRAKFRDAMRTAGLFHRIDPAVWTRNWVVRSQAVGDGRAALKYLAAYVFRTALTDRRILSCQDDQVTFSYRKSGSRRPRRMTLPADEFLRRFLQHVLPRGFQKVRAYGFLSPNARRSFDAVRWLASLHAGEPFVLRAAPTSITPSPPSGPRCSDCGGDLRRIGVLRFVGRALFDTSYPRAISLSPPPHLRDSALAQPHTRARPCLDSCLRTPPSGRSQPLRIVSAGLVNPGFTRIYLPETRRPADRPALSGSSRRTNPLNDVEPALTRAPRSLNTGLQARLRSLQSLIS